MNPWPGRATVTPAEIAKATGKNAKAIVRLIEGGKLRAIKINGRTWDVPIDDALRVIGQVDEALRLSGSELLSAAAAPAPSRTSRTPLQQRLSRLSRAH